MVDEAQSRRAMNRQKSGRVRGSQKMNFATKIRKVPLADSLRPSYNIRKSYPTPRKPRYRRRDISVALCSAVASLTTLVSLGDVSQCRFLALPSSYGLF